MYQAGLGTDRNLEQARAMYRRAIEFGSTSAKRNLDKVYASESNAVALALVFPEYR